jgi:hypothetical protein
VHTLESVHGSAELGSESVELGNENVVDVMEDALLVEFGTAVVGDVGTSEVLFGGGRGALAAESIGLENG